MEMKGERTNFAQHSETGPPVQIGHVILGEDGEVDLESVEAPLRVPTQVQQMVHEFSKLLDRSVASVVALDVGDAQACGELPEVTPAPREHARTHGLLRREEGEEMVEDIVREGADAVDGTRLGCYLHTGRHTGGGRRRCGGARNHQYVENRKTKMEPDILTWLQAIRSSQEAQEQRTGESK
jgi:hypothetical protein